MSNAEKVARNDQKVDRIFSGEPPGGDLEYLSHGLDLFLLLLHVAGFVLLAVFSFGTVAGVILGSALIWSAHQNLQAIRSTARVNASIRRLNASINVLFHADNSNNESDQ